MSEENPYAPSQVTLDESLSPPLPARGFHRNGDLLVISDGAVLPARCIKTNQPISSADWTRAKKVYWTPPWVWFLVLASPLIAVIVSAILQKKATLTYSLSRSVRVGYLKKTTFSLSVFVLGLVLMIYSFGNESSSWQMAGIIGGISMLFLGLILAVVLSRAISVKKYQDGWFSIKGCSPEFLASIE